jgi:hypothetical protein
LIGNKVSLEQQIHEITGIDIAALRGSQSLHHFSVEERLKWGENRQTTEEEDAAYCLGGLFDIYITLKYGEGRKNATDRLRRKIQKSLASESKSSGKASSPGNLDVMANNGEL